LYVVGLLERKEIIGFSNQVVSADVLFDKIKILLGGG
jgi:hypothetical protein